MFPPPESPEGDIPDFVNVTEADRHFLKEAFLERKLSDDPKALTVPQSGVGAVIVGVGGIEIARSANVVPPRLRATMESSGQTIEGEDRYYLVEHAERSAIFKALTSGKSLDGTTMYCTRFPCSDCARAIAWSGIERLVVPTGFAGEQRWLEQQRAALRLLRDSSVKIRYLGTPDLI